MLGYDLYSSALADILSEPTMQPPICVGLYAQWGSGKSFLLKKLEGEGHTYTHTYTHTLIHTHGYTHMDPHTLIHTVTRGYTHTWIHAHTHTQAEPLPLLLR